MPNPTIDRASTQCLARCLTQPAARCERHLSLGTEDLEPELPRIGGVPGELVRHHEPIGPLRRFHHAPHDNLMKVVRLPRGGINARRPPVEAASECNEMAWTQCLQ